MDYRKHLKNLRNKLSSQQLSLLVGAGLSRNVSPLFLNWEELLVDLAYELHKSEVDAAFAEYQKSQDHPEIEEKDFVAKRCIQHIRTDGYLEIVSEFIKRRGCVESITTYIEERIPSVFLKGNKYYLEKNGDCEELPREKLSLHRSIVDLPWNNIYTTNYDELLDVCVDRDRYDSLLRDIADLGNEINDKERKIRELDQELERLSKGNNSGRRAGSEENPLEEVPESGGKPKEELEQEKTNLILQKANLKNTRTQQESLQRSKEKELYDCFQVVKSADGLRIKKQKNIIKLHGSLRSADDKDKYSFEFDGDHKNQYIIAKEDYENYPTRHEAFTQLMRISLLQESFCLLGFSGVDPNFRAWLNWVRDILHKAAKKTRTTNDYKIYLIEASKKPVSKDMQLFYENHSIVRIPLLDPDVLNIISEDIKKPLDLNENDRRQALEAFMLYLNNDEDVKVAIPSANVSLRAEYRQLWEKVNVYDPEKIPNETIVSAAVNKLDTIHRELWIPDLDYYNTHHQQSLVDYCMRFGWDHQFHERPDLVRLLRYAIAGIFVPIKNLVGELVIQKLQENEYSATATQRMIDRSEALAANLNLSLPEVHDQILQLAYSFQFTALAEFLKGRKLEGKDLIVASGFLALIDPKHSAQMLEQAIWNEDLGRGEQMLYGLELLYFITQPRLSVGDVRVARLISAFKHSGYKLLQDAIDRLTKQVEKKRDKQKPYGSGRFFISRSIQLSKGSDGSKSAVQMLMLLAESGFQLSINNVYLQSHDAWYPVFKAGFQFYPSAFLFYSLQYSNKDFLKKVGQDYAFSNDGTVVDSLEGICEALFRCFEDGPAFIKDHIPDFLSGLIIGVAPATWQSPFGVWWQSLIDDRLAFKKDHFFRHPTLINTAVLYINDKKLLLKIISDCLRSVISEDEEDQAINILYQLNKNIYFRRLKLSEKESEEINGLLQDLIKELSSPRIALIFVMGNLFSLLNDTHKTHIKEKLKSLDLKQINGSRVWRIIVYFSGGDEELNTKIQDALVVHRLLWFTGIRGGKILRGGKDEYIQISTLTSPPLEAGGLRWTDSNIQIIYDRMVAALLEVDRIHVDNQWFNFTDILEEMAEFLDTYKDQLAFQNNYETVVEIHRKCLVLNRNYSDLEEGLSSRDGNEVITALAQLNKQIYQNKIDSNLINLTLNKVLLQAEPALEESLYYLSAWVADNKCSRRFESEQSLLIRILKKYDANPLTDLDEAFVEENLVRIAWRLNTWEVVDPIVQRWLEKGRNSKFNNVLQFLIEVQV
ncbi:SIR2 family protein [Chitinophagaceae bacterium 26-R-25]|nr:SIR2 family protein [Chitinophagaceae bacterium 26-R-25]